jgi:hypothetical protein
MSEVRREKQDVDEMRQKRGLKGGVELLPDRDRPPLRVPEGLICRSPAQHFFLSLHDTREENN